MEALSIHVQGIVQGVGFRPFVYRIAHQHGIRGWVLNASDGVHIHAEAPTEALDAFVLALSQEEPSAAQVKEIDLLPTEVQGFTDFTIHFSNQEASEETTLVSPDLATCDHCVEELFDPANRRYRYPFINCTQCGPRFTIINKLPYDRPHTSMANFTLCTECQHEYEDPADIRFHAQPDACFECGPKLSWSTFNADTNTFEPWVWASNRLESDALISQAVAALKQGEIVALKGMGGFHLACDATNEHAVAELRRRKRRPHKPFALMLPSVEVGRRWCSISQDEEEQLRSSAAPIVLCRKKAGAAIPLGLADGFPELGLMLPSTPLQHLILADFDTPLVMTSGNLHGLPIIADDELAREKFAGIAHAILGNDRPIVARYDDSVIRLLDLADGGSAFQMIRRARGYAPKPIALPDNLCAQASGTSQLDASSEASEVSRETKTLGADSRPEARCDSHQTTGEAQQTNVSCETGVQTTANKDQVSRETAQSKSASQGEKVTQEQVQLFATGPEQKVTFGFSREKDALISQHLGDLESMDVFEHWEQSKAHFENLFQLHPTTLVTDYHPEYLSSKWAAKQGYPVIRVQHHQAHIASVLAENNQFGPALGFAFDGTGYGLDGQLWGGEVLLANLENFERFANFSYLPLPGGAAAIKSPERIGYAALWEYGLTDHPAAQAFINKLKEAEMLEKMLEQGINCPYSSSVGRLFDAAAALLGLATDISFEGQAAQLLEGLISEEDRLAPLQDALDDAARYQFALLKNTATQNSTAQDTSVLLIDPAPVFEALLHDLQEEISVSLISRRFHLAFVELMAMLYQLVYGNFEITQVALGGGCFMNRYLSTQAITALSQAGATVLINKELPPNDGCISYGQLVVARSIDQIIQDEKEVRLCV